MSLLDWNGIYTKCPWIEFNLHYEMPAWRICVKAEQMKFMNVNFTLCIINTTHRVILVVPVLPRHVLLLLLYCSTFTFHLGSLMLYLHISFRFSTVSAVWDLVRWEPTVNAGGIFNFINIPVFLISLRFKYFVGVSQLGLITGLDTAAGSNLSVQTDDIPPVIDLSWEILSSHFL